MTDHSATKSYLEKNNLHCFTLFPNFEKPIKAVIHSPPPPILSIGWYSQQPWGLRLEYHQREQMTATGTAPKGQIYTEPFLLFLEMLRSQQIFKVNILCHIVIKVELYRVQTGLTRCYNCWGFGHQCQQQATTRCAVQQWPPAWGTSWKGKYRIHPRRRRETTCSVMLRLQPWGRKLGERSSLSSSHQSSPSLLHCNTSNQRHHRQMGKICGPHAATGNSENNSLRTVSQLACQNVTVVLQQIDRHRAQWSCIKRQNNGPYKNSIVRNDT